ncbi:MAG: GumC family protein [Sphingosinicella sp.]
MNEMEARGQNPVWPVAPSESALVIGGGAPTGYSYMGTGATELNLATLWRIVNEWRWFILGAVAIGLAIAVVYTLLATPIYRASAIIELNPPQMEVMDENRVRGVQMMQRDREFLATQVGLLRSRSLAERVVQELNLAADENLAPEGLNRAAREGYLTSILAGNFDANPARESRIVHLFFTSPDAGLAARVVNGFADGFINSGLERRYQSSSYAREFLQRQIATTRRELENSERQLVAYAQQQNIIDTGGSGQARGESNDINSLSGESLIALNEALAVVEARRINAEQRYRESLRAGATAEVSENTANLRGQRAGLEAEYQEKSAIFRPDYPEMVRLRSRIDSLSEAVDAEAATIRTGRANTLRAEYQAAVAEERQIGARIEQLRGRVLDERGRSIQYNILQRDVDTNRALYDALLQRYKEIGVAGGIGTAGASVVDRAEVPGAPFTPNMMFNLLIGLGLGLLAGLSGAIAVEFINDTIKSPDDVRMKLQLAYLGAVPKRASQQVLEELQDTSSSLSESYFSVGTSLQFSSDSGVPRTLFITSTRASEGKSTSSWAIAQSFARIGKRVLLIDADMRKPSFKTGLENPIGLSNLLTNSEPLASGVLQTEAENIWLLTAGPTPPNPAELLSSTRLPSLLREAMAQFDLTVVDGPPVLGLADAPLLAAACQGAMMVVESGRTRTRAAVEALNRLRTAGAHMVGAILTRYRQEGYGYGYYNYDPYRYGRSIESRASEIRLVTQRGS